MASRLVELPWTEQPQEAVSVDWSNPLARGLREWDAPALRPYLPLGTPTLAPTRGGVAFTGGGASARYRNADQPSLDVTGARTVLAVFVGVGATDTRAYGIADSGNYIFYLGSSPITAARGRIWFRFPSGDVDIGQTSATVFEANVPHTFVLRQTPGTPASFASFVDGIADASGTGTVSGSASGVQVGINGLVRASGGASYNASGVLLGLVWDRALSDAEIAAVSANPWQLFQPRRIPVPVSAAGGGGVTLDTLAGSYSTTGQSIGLRVSRTLSLTAGSYSTTGQSATLRTARKLTTTAGSYAVSGQSLGLRISRKLTTVAGVYSLTGQSVVLDRGGTGLNLTAGSYAITGYPLTLTVSRKLTTVAGSYSVTGPSTTLTYTPVVGATYSLTLLPGSYTLSGQSLGLTVSRSLFPSVGVYALTGRSMRLAYSGEPAVTPPVLRRKLDPYPKFPADMGLMVRKLTDLFREHAAQVNAMTFTYGIGDWQGISITNPTFGQALVYDGTNWVNDSVAGGSGNSVTVACDFGASFTDKAQTVVTGQTWVAAGSEIVAHVLTPTGVDPDEMRLLDLRPVISDLVAGTGFTLTLYSEPEAKGSYSVMCIGV